MKKSNTSIRVFWTALGNRLDSMSIRIRPPLLMMISEPIKVSHPNASSETSWAQFTGIPMVLATADQNTRTAIMHNIAPARSSSVFKITAEIFFI